MFQQEKKNIPIRKKKVFHCEKGKYSNKRRKIFQLEKKIFQSDKGKYSNQKKENILIKKGKYSNYQKGNISNLTLEIYKQQKLQEEEDEDDENKNIRPQEGAHGQKCQIKAAFDAGIVLFLSPESFISL